MEAEFPQLVIVKSITRILIRDCSKWENSRRTHHRCTYIAQFNNPSENQNASSNGMTFPHLPLNSNELMNFRVQNMANTPAVSENRRVLEVLEKPVQLGAAWGLFAVVVVLDASSGFSVVI